MKKYLALISTLFLFLCNCGPSSRVTSSWVKPKANTVGIRSVMVLAMTGSTNHGLRERMETSLANDLRKSGYTAYSYYQEYGPNVFDSRDEEKVVQQMSDKNVDAVLTVVLLNKELERYYVPGRIYYTPYGLYYNRFWGYYTTVYDRIYSPGYYTTNTEYFWESNLYNVHTGDIIYSAQTRSFNPGSAGELAEDYSKVIVEDMKKKGLLN